jgi:hypothetical protein
MKNYHSLMRCSIPFKSDVFVKEIDRFGFNGVREHLVSIHLKLKLILKYDAKAIETSSFQ